MWINNRLYSRIKSRYIASDSDLAAWRICLYTTSQARVFIPSRTTAKTLVAAGHVNTQILGVIRIIASLGTKGGVRREIASKVKILCKKL